MDSPAVQPAAQVSGADGPEARETSGLTSTLMLRFAEREGGGAAVDAVLRRAGLSERERELRDENAWFSFETKIRLFEALAEVLDDPAATRRAGAAALEMNVGDGLKVALRALGSPRLVYQQVVRANAKFSTRHAMKLVSSARAHARIAFWDLTGGEVHPLDCQYNIGLLSCVPALFGQGPARITHPVCAARDGDRCIYEISWDEGAGSVRSALAGGLVAASALAGSALAAPALLPAAGVVAAGAAGLAGRRWLAARRARWRQLETEARDQRVLADRLAGSLQDLVGELRLEELLDKIVSNAEAAVGGKQFALLVDDDGQLSCRSSSGLPGASVAAVERWAQSLHPLAAVELVEDVSLVPALAPLADDRVMPLATVLAAPLIYRGATIGVLLALATRPRTFLPRDADVVNSYATQAAIALSNARLFAAQQELAARDPLTGLLNHREFHEAVDAALEHCRQRDEEASVILFDLDGFKLVNDASGHAAGDRVLRETAAMLIDAAPDGAAAFRVGGDEFALLLPSMAPSGAEAVAGALAASIDASALGVGASYGIAACPRDGWSKDVLLAQADTSLYAMKSVLGRDRAPAEAVTTRVQHERLAMASRLSAKLAPVLGPERMATEAVAELVDSFRYFLAYVQRLVGDELHVVATSSSVDGEPAVPVGRQPVSAGVCGRVARTGRPALVHNAELDPDHYGVGAVDPGSSIKLRSQLSVPLRVGDRLWGVISIEDTEAAAFGAEDVLLIDMVASQVSAAIHRSELFTELENAFATTLGVLCDAVEAKDEYTARHADDVGELARRVGARLALDDAQLRDLHYAALLHDIGKIAIPTAILRKRGPLTPEERVEIERHTVVGADMLRRIPFFASVHQAVRSSHERWDGGGYPDGLAGETIPLPARIIAACDTFHAMTSDRPYRAALSRAEAEAELRRCAGSQFDPRIVDALLAELAAGGGELPQIPLLGPGVEAASHS